VIYADDGLLSHQTMFPLFDNLYQGIELLVVDRVVENCPMKYFRMIVMQEHHSYSTTQQHKEGVYPEEREAPTFSFYLKFII
jgi:hypothetical protein